MNTSGSTARRRTELWRARLGAVLALLMVLAFATVCTTYTYSIEAPGAAYAAIYTADDEEQASDQAAEAANDEAAEGEQIADEENPMSSGLGGGEPVTANGGMGMGITIAIVAGIIAVVAFFGFSTGRLNSSIKKMNDTFK